jgi:hypothetical protein
LLQFRELDPNHNKAFGEEPIYLEGEWSTTVANDHIPYATGYIDVKINNKRKKDHST